MFQQHGDNRTRPRAVEYEPASSRNHLSPQFVVAQLTLGVHEGEGAGRAFGRAQKHFVHVELLVSLTLRQQSIECRPRDDR
eukprot:scaffold211702_cov27-Tisochrysis_lutea.AAC.2